MEDFIQILINYWKPIVGLIFFVISLVIAIIRKKPVTSILDDIYQYAILAVNVVESDAILDPSFKGADKLNRAVAYVIHFLNNKYPTLNAEKYLSDIEMIIESILTTPQKKV